MTTVELIRRAACESKSRQTRRAALRLLAVRRDAHLSRILVRIAERDPSARVRDYARRLLDRVTA